MKVYNFDFTTINDPTAAILPGLPPAPATPTGLSGHVHREKKIKRS